MKSDLLLFPSPSTTRLEPSPGQQESLSDAQAREAALDIHRSWIVEAPAGSGKTGLLIQRFLKLLAYADIQRPTEVLVLTFTRKADGELRSRILDQLTAAAENTPLPPSAGPFEHSTREFAAAVLARDCERDWQLLQSPAQLNIRTIDSFCADLARARPLLAGGGRLRPIDDAFPLYQLAAERTLAQLGGPDRELHEALRLLLQHRDAQVSDCLHLLVDMLAQREQWSELLPLDASALTDEYLDAVVLQRLNQTLRRIVAEGLQRAADALGEADLEAISDFAVRISGRPGYKGDANAFAILSHVRGPLSSSADFLPEWKQLVTLLLKGDGDWRRTPRANHLKCDLDKVDLDWLQQFVAHLAQRLGDSRTALHAARQLPPAEYPEGAWPLIKALCRILSRALAELRSVFAARVQCDFTEVALTARALLRPDPATFSQASMLDPLSTPAGTLNHLLVDEMQDTSSGQYALLEALTEYWDGASQTVFLVGDPKQSIYAFRQARVERFLRTMATCRLGDLPLSPLRLTANFRSQGGLVDSFNNTFTPIFAGARVPESEEATDDVTSGADETIVVPFVAATAVRTAAPGTALHWHIASGPVATGSDVSDHPSNGRQDSLQAQEIRARIEDFYERWPQRCQTQGLRQRAPTIAVLARNRSHLAPILNEFKVDRGKGVLPFRAVDVEALNDRPEILDLLALTRALLHPADRVAWLAVLRSPLCGLSLADLLALTGEGQGADDAATVPFLVESRRQHLSQEGQGLLQRSWGALSHAQATLGSTDFSTLVERTWVSLGGNAPLSPEQRRNAHRYLDLLRKLESSGEVLSVPLLERGLERLYAEAGSTDAIVELMTIHKAKGLEWDLVLIPSLDKGTGQNQHGLLKWLELDNPDRDADLLLAPIQSKGDDTSPLSRWLNRGVRRREAAEAQRLFYVACTRAREELHLFAAVQTKADGSLVTPSAPTSLLRAAWPAAQPIVESQLQSQPTNVVPFATSPEDVPLALAAAADVDLTSTDAPQRSRAPRIQRLPADFEPSDRLRPNAVPVLPYPAPEALQRTPAFSRPDGSFSARAFGNTVHRFLERIATRLAAGESLASLQQQVPAWTSRFITVLRNEGLPANQAVAEAQRATEALMATLQHPEGAWILGPHTQARNEGSLSVMTGAGSLRADRTFLAGATPVLPDAADHLWIVDYKTADLGGKVQQSFLAEQKHKYLAQMEAYASAAERRGTPRDRIVLALYFPLLPALLSWPAMEPEQPR